MIAYLNGRLRHKSPDSIIVDVAGVGYELLIPLCTYYKLPDIGNSVQLHVYMHVREDTIQLFGFWTPAEKDLFIKLISVSKIGPRLGRNILSGLAADKLKRAIVAEDIAVITTIPGVGRKVAERLIMELRDKLAKSITEAESDSIEDDIKNKNKIDDIVSALVNLGYKQEASRAAVRKSIKALGADKGLEAMLKHALSLMAKR